MLANGIDWSSLLRTVSHGCGPSGRRGCSFMVLTLRCFDVPAPVLGAFRGQRRDIGPFAGCAQPRRCDVLGTSCKKSGRGETSAANRVRSARLSVDAGQARAIVRAAALAPVGPPVVDPAFVVVDAIRWTEPKVEARVNVLRSVRGHHATSGHLGQLATEMLAVAPFVVGGHAARHDPDRADI